MSGMRAGRLAGLAVLAAPLALLPASSTQASAPTATASAAVAPALPAGTRVAFTDERDALNQVSVTADLATGIATSLHPAVTGYAAEPIHEGELSTTLAGAGSFTTPLAALAVIAPSSRIDLFVSTRDAPTGEVYAAIVAAGEEEPGELRRITCNDVTETHPVLAAGGIAYASDADGDWDIYLTRPLEEAEEPPAEAVADPAACESDWITINLTAEETGDGPYDDLWPAYHPTTGDLVFSRAAEGALPDLWRARSFEGEGWELAPLTETENIAETQSALTAFTPDVETGEVESWVAFTSTQDRTDGSIRLLQMPEFGEPGEPVATWEGPPPQGSEPAWSRLVISDSVHLAFTSTESDPYGDIWIAELDTPGLFSDSRLHGRAGVAESHPAWLNPPGGEPAEPTGLLGYTSRVNPGLEPDADRLLDADVSDALATDGTDRAVIVDEVIDGVRFDEAGPDYSPDGEQIAYSTNDDTAESEAGGREIRVANADGTAAESLADLTGHEPGDIDRDPVWSPDGTRIAFVREQFVADGEFTFHRRPKVWVVDLEAATAVQVTPDTYTDDTSNFRPSDAHPDWSPDGNQLVVQREPGLVTVDRPPPGWATTSSGFPARAESRAMPESGLWVIPAQLWVDGGDVGVAVAYTTVCPTPECGTLTVAVEGRTPAWSPALDLDADGVADESQLVWSEHGRLRIATVVENADGSFDEITIPTVLTGGISEDGPTESATILSRADDPAWAPDGSEIAFAGQPIGQPDQRGIWAITPDGTGLRTITDGRGPETEPTYSAAALADVAVELTVTGSPAEPGDAVTAKFTVTNLGPDPAEEVTLTTSFAAGATLSAAAPPAGCLADGTGCAFGTLAAGGTRTYSVAISHDSPVTGLAVGSVATTTEESDLTNNVARAPYAVGDLRDIAVAIELDEPTGYVGGFRTATITVTNEGGELAEDVTLTADWPDLVIPGVPEGESTPQCLPDGDECALGDLSPGGEETFEVALEGAPFPDEATLEGTATITTTVATTSGDHQPDNNVAEAEIEMLQPTIRVVPGVVRPRQVIVIYGERMPPGSQVELTDPAELPVTIDPSIVTVTEEGTFQAPVYIIPGSQVGTWEWTATSTTELFTPVTTELLVTLRQLTPPQFVGRG